jgi:hypothetical protein
MESLHQDEFFGKIKSTENTTIPSTPRGFFSQYEDDKIIFTNFWCFLPREERQ